MSGSNEEYGGGLGSSVAWMSPECLRGEVVNKQANVYSFGVVMWECWTRQRPWANLQGEEESEAAYYYYNYYYHL